MQDLDHHPISFEPATALPVPPLRRPAAPGASTNPKKPRCGPPKKSQTARGLGGARGPGILGPGPPGAPSNLVRCGSARRRGGRPEL